MVKRVAILSIALVCMFVAYVFIPKREFSISIFPLRSNEILFAYDDKADGGASVSRMALSDSLLDFYCTLDRDTSKSAWCGLIWNLSAEGDEFGRYENWSLVDSIVMDVFAERDAEIIAKVWTFDPDVTNRDSLRTFRQMLKEISLRKGENHIAVPFKDFYVPDFWFRENHADKDLVQRHKEHVARFEITPGWESVRGERLHFRFTRIEAKGIGSMEMAVFLACCVVILVVALGFIKKKT